MVDRRGAVKSQVVTTSDCAFIIVATITRVLYIKDMECADNFSRAMEALQDSGHFGRSGGEKREHLEYLADLLGELQLMAEREGCRKLSRMLAISHAEARRETDRHQS
ncbi:hypothetical protein [Hyphomicrobium facile]|uniref:Uncharacterized protein n=1 Tax=Hyphomicrobium facile TaxID=51670 RepID=A0A1I7N0X6_9HYPH|nr:hypothetical protein [Hyphomicrobium facile]SFV28330.1 hypothetical protein SAMN04488557_0975 [Hyphomicrobium facile]